jgi:uncharacterized membrane protein
MTILVIGLIVFFTIHSVSIINHNWRIQLVKNIGVMPWQAIYSIVSIIGFVMIVYGFGLARTHPVVLYSPPNWLHHITMVLMIPVFPMLLATYLPGRIQTTLKHPMLAATKLWAFAHLLANGTLADVLLFGAFLVWAVVDRISLKHRTTDAVPVAMRSKLNDTLVIVIGLALYAVFVLGLHKWLIGVPILK